VQKFVASMTPRVVADQAESAVQIWLAAFDNRSDD
jgi:hypothetical protein